MNQIFAQLLKPFAPMAQDEIEPEPPKPIGRWDMLPVAPVADRVRQEVRDMLTAADLYDEQADSVRNEADALVPVAVRAQLDRLIQRANYLEQLARQARQQSENLERIANL